MYNHSEKIERKHRQNRSQYSIADAFEFYDDDQYRQDKNEIDILFLHLERV